MARQQLDRRRSPVKRSLPASNPARGAASRKLHGSYRGGQPINLVWRPLHFLDGKTPYLQTLDRTRAASAVAPRRRRVLRSRDRDNARRTRIGALQAPESRALALAKARFVQLLYNLDRWVALPWLEVAAGGPRYFGLTMMAGAIAAGAIAAGAIAAGAKRAGLLIIPKIITESRAPPLSSTAMSDSKLA